jgi:hypothetical protein
MKSRITLLLLSSFLWALNLNAQGKIEAEIEIHSNVKLIEVTVPQDMPQSLKDRYQAFLPLFIQTLKEKTADQPSDASLTIRIAPSVKEIGSAKTKRVIAQVTAYRRGVKSEYIANLLLHSYATGENVGKDEIEQFLTKQILGPLGIG